MSTLYALTQAQAVANLRTDLNDPSGAGSRWQDTDLQRALDRALERLTAVEPDLEEVQLATGTAQRIYAKPAGALWIDRVEYPADQWPHAYPAFSELRTTTMLPPQTLPALTSKPNALSLIPAGVHNWAYTYVTVGGETTLSPLAGLNLGANQEVDLILPTPPADVLQTNIYRSALGTPSTLKLLNSIFGTANTYADTANDTSLGATAPTINTTGGTDAFRLEIPPEQYPPDQTSYTIKVRYALKHELDTNGTTLPERHWDALYLGAMVAAADMYLANVNDNFVYADGQLRDRVDDTKSVDAWRAYRFMLEEQFTERLKRIRDEQIQSSRYTPVWGDKPLRWEKV